MRATAADGADLEGELLRFGERAGSVAAFSSRSLLFVRDIRDNPAVDRSIFKGTEVVSALWLPVEQETTRSGRHRRRLARARSTSSPSGSSGSWG